MKNRKNATLISICINMLLLCIIVFIIAIYNKPFSDNIRGTYYKQNEDMYIVFQSDNSYIIYKQLDLLDRGSYECSNTYDKFAVYNLNSERQTKANAVYDGKTIILLDSDNMETNFEKISKDCMYANVDIDAPL